MARARLIRPEFFTDEKTGSLSLGAQVLFIGSWTQADIAGVLEWNAKQLRACLFPFQDVTTAQVAAWMQEVESAGLVRAFTSDGKRFGHVPKFTKHQWFSTAEKKHGKRNPSPPSDDRQTTVSQPSDVLACHDNPSTSPSTATATATTSDTLAPSMHSRPEDFAGEGDYEAPSLHVEPSKTVTGSTDRFIRKPAPPSVPLNLPARLRDAYREIADAQGGGEIGFLVATKALEAAKRLHGPPSPDQLLQVYRCAHEKGMVERPAAEWPDFRKVMEAERRQKQSGTTATHSDDDRAHFARMDQKAKK